MSRILIAIAVGCLLFTASLQEAVAQPFSTASAGLGMTPFSGRGLPMGSIQEPESDSGDFEFEDYELEEEADGPYDRPLETERHDFTQSARVVGRGVLQLESGVLYTTKEEGGERETAYATPELLVRYGLTDRLEFRSRINHAWKFRESEEDASGMLDTIFSLKYQVTEVEEMRPYVPESALEIRLAAPTGSDEFGTDKWLGGFDFIYQWECGEYFTLAGSTGGNSNAIGDFAFFNPETNRDDGFMAWSQSLALGARLTRRSTGYVEWFGVFTHGREEELQLGFFNLGVDFLLTNNLLIDARVGWGLNDDSDDLFAGLGGAVRF